MKIQVFLALALGLASCSDDSKNEATASSTSLELNFKARAGDQLLDCDSEISSLGQNEVRASLEDLRFYLHDLKAYDASGTSYNLDLEDNDWQSDGVVLIDFQNKADKCSGDSKDTNTSITASVATSSITAIEFTLGVPADRNHKDSAEASSPLNIPSLLWSWQAGYKFARIDIKPEGGITRPSDEAFSSTTFNFHLGSTGCSGDPSQEEEVECTNPNRISYRLDFNPDSNDTIVFDLAKLLENSNLSSDQAVASGCMSGATDPECQAIFTAIGLSEDSEQSIFSVE